MTARDLIHKILKGRQALPPVSRRSPTPPEVPSPAPATGNPCHLPTPVPQRGTAPPTGNLPPRDAQAAHGDGAGREPGKTLEVRTIPRKTARRDGITFDSLLERKWYDALKTAGIPQRYTGRDKPGFPIGGQYCYPPDFYLPGLDIYLEIKPKGMDFKKAREEDGRCEIWKWARFRREVRAGRLPGRDAVLVVGPPTQKAIARLQRDYAEEGKAA
jgi:hypothetical protein